MSRTSVTAGALVLLLAACASGSATGDAVDDPDLVDAAAGEGEVTLYVVPQEETITRWVDPFVGEYGIGVVTQRQSQNQLYERFEQETRADQHLADILIFNDPSLLVEAREEGWIEDFTPSTDDAFPDDAKESGSWYMVYNSGEVLAWNTNQVTEEEAERLRSDGFAALAEGDWDGRIATVTPAATDRVFATYYRLGETLADEFGWEYLEQLGAATSTFYESAAPANERLVAGEHAVLIGSADTIAAGPMAAGAPIDFVYPNPTTAAPFFMAISSNAPNPNAAQLFVEWATSDEGLAELVESSNGLPPREGIEDRRELADFEGYEAPEELDDGWATDDEMWAAQEEFLQRWGDAFGYSR